MHVPAYLQAGAPAVEPLDCALYDEPTYEEECPPPGIELCGGPMGISPIDGTSIRRPYRKMRKTCTFGCECADGEEVETYESCAVADSVSAGLPLLLLPLLLLPLPLLPLLLLLPVSYRSAAATSAAASTAAHATAAMLLPTAPLLRLPGLSLHQPAVRARLQDRL